eukprot:jgi/Mesvir1/24590/Mv21911-RA.3
MGATLPNPECSLEWHSPSPTFGCRVHPQYLLYHGWLPLHCPLQERFTCPKGHYLDGSPTSLAEKERMLQSHVLWLLREGYEVMPGWETGVKLAGNRMWTYSDPMWPKPAHCKGGWGDATAVYNDCMTTNTGRMAFNHKYRFFFRLVTKAASTTIVQTSTTMLKGTQTVHYWVGRPGHLATSCHRIVEPPNVKGALAPYTASQRYLVMGSVREPLARFISGFNNLAARTGHGPRTYTASFVELVQKAFECADYTWGSRAWDLKGFIHFLPTIGYFLLPHLLYAGENDTVPHIDKLFRVEVMGELVPYLERVRAGTVTAAGPRGAAPVKENVAAKKQLRTEHENVLPHEPLTLQLMKALSGQPDVVRIFCRAFIQDFICFDYPLPRECADMIPAANHTLSLASSFPSLSLPSVSWSQVESELGEVYRAGAQFTLDGTKVNRLFLVIIGVLVAMACWQRYQLIRMVEEERGSRP